VPLSHDCSRFCESILLMEETSGYIGNESVRKIIMNNTIDLFFYTVINILLILDHCSFWVLFDKIASIYCYYVKNYLYFSIENGQPREPALCRLYRNTFVPCYLSGIWSSCRFWHSFHTVLSMSQFAPVSDCKFSGADAIRYSPPHLDRKWFCRRYVTFYVFISKCLTELVYWD